VFGNSRCVHETSSTGYFSHDKDAPFKHSTK